MDADDQVYWSYSQPPATMATSISLPPHLQVDLLPELKPPSMSLQAAVSSIFSCLKTEANTSDGKAKSTIEMTAVELLIELGHGH